MLMKSMITAGILSLSTLVWAGPSQAESFGVGFHGPNGGFYFHSGDGGHHGKKYYKKRGRGWGHGQGHWQGHRGKLTPYQVRQTLRHRGFRQIRFFDRHGRVYRANAVNRRGRPIGLAINAWTGQIINRWPLYYY